ncbi:peptidase inhibitor family I36 protein [Streptomyces sp. NPDC101166]|uniref:peptidase inhibitor family I36 protein n=1 Tax=Streptomyces sp. NPDC101166 TaxID=3366120 RepID=UPI00380243F9
MNTIRRLFNRLSLAGLAVVTLAASLVWLQTGSAQAAYADCEPTKFCLYTEPGGKGDMVAISPGVELDYATDARLQGKTFRSVRNRTLLWGCLYDDPEYGGTAMQAVTPERTGDATLGADFSNMTPASHKFVKSQSACRTGFERCTATRVCIFKGPSGRGVGGVTTQDDLGNGVSGNSSYSKTWNDAVVSVSNRSDKVACFYPEPGYTGRWQDQGTSFRAYVLLPGEETTLPTPLRSKFSSHKLADSESGC